MDEATNEPERSEEEPDATAGQWPYAAAPAADLEAIRQEHARAEGNLRGVGSYVRFVGWCSVFWVGMVLAGDPKLSHGSVAPALVGLPYIVTGGWLRKLEARGRTATSALVVLGFVVGLASPWLSEVDQPLLVDAFGVAFNIIYSGVMLGLLWNRRANTVFSRHYQETVIPATPHVKTGSKLFWVLMVGTMILFPLLGFLAARSASGT